MKIIASAGANKWLAEIDSHELRLLDSETKIEIGVEYEITKAVETLVALRSLSRHKLEYVDRDINDLQKKFKEIKQAYDALMMLDNIKNIEKYE